jgi:hypothetical protein
MEAEILELIHLLLGLALKVQTFALLTPFMGLYPPSATLAAYDASVSSTGILDVLIRNNSTAGGNSRVTAGAFTADTFGFATATRNNNVLSTFLNSSSNGTSSSLASGVNFTRTDTQSFITSRQNDPVAHGLSTVAFAFLIKGQAISPSSFYTLYKTTLGQLVSDCRKMPLLLLALLLCSCSPQKDNTGLPRYTEMEAAKDAGVG